MHLTRRSFVGKGVRAFAALQMLRAGGPPPSSLGTPPIFHTENTRWQATYDAALHVLAGNVRELPRFPHPVLIEGAEYAGIWQECGPHEAFTYRRFRPDVARNSHLTFFALQRPDGQLPANNKLTESGFGQIQMVVPIAATAWELAQATGDSELLEKAYTSCSAWDAWLLRYRNTRNTGLIEGFCTYDTGMDNSPRWAGMPNQCPAKDARRCPPVATLPRLCPDLSATVYGARRALAAMARALGKSADVDRWTVSAETLRELILTRLYVEKDAAFYDLDAQNNYVRVRTDILSRLCGEHIPDQRLFDHLWTQQLGDAQAFWPAYPLPSVALDDPAFVRPIPRNSWGGASQALTALRAGRWFDHYNHSAELAQLMQAWCEAIERDGTFRQQVNPQTGEFTQGDAPGYSPAALVFVDFTWRLAGIHETPEALHWNVRPWHPATQGARFTLTTDGGSNAVLVYTANGARLLLNGRMIANVQGGAARLVTDKRGVVQSCCSISTAEEHITLQRPHHRAESLRLLPHQQHSLASAIP